MTFDRREKAAFVALAIAAVAAWALVPTYPDYDAYHHLLWGRDLLNGEKPGFETFAAPTQHPLYIGICALLSLAGDGADRLLVLLTMLSLAALVAGAYALGRELFGRWPAVAGALCVGSSFAFLLYAVRAFVDVPFLALVMWAAALEVAQPRRGLAPMALLAAAGLLRPEAWVLAGLYWLWCLHGRRMSERVGLLLLVVAAPGGWALADWAVTGDPLFSLHGTQALADLLGRERGIENVPSALVTFLADVARPPVAVAGALGIVLGVRRFGWARMAVPLALLGAGVLTFVATGIAGLSIIQRYLTVPAVTLCVLAGFALLGFTTLDAGLWRARWRAGAIAGLVLGVLFLALKSSSFGRLADELRFIRATHTELQTLLEGASRDTLSCGPLTFPTYRLVPDARWILDAGPAEVRSRAEDPRRGALAAYVDPDAPAEDAAKFARRFGRADGVSRKTNVPPRRPPDLRTGPFTVYVTQRC